MHLKKMRSFGSKQKFECDTFEVGDFGTPNWRLFYASKNGPLISPWHGVPLFSGSDPHIILEIPLKLDIEILFQLNKKCKNRYNCNLITSK